VKNVTPSMSPLVSLGTCVIVPLSLHVANSSLVLKFCYSSKASNLPRSMSDPVPRP
jgi:hypothetical protein